MAAGVVGRVGLLRRPSEATASASRPAVNECYSDDGGRDSSSGDSWREFHLEISYEDLDTGRWAPPTLRSTWSSSSAENIPKPGRTLDPGLIGPSSSRELDGGVFDPLIVAVAFTSARTGSPLSSISMIVTESYSASNWALEQRANIHCETRSRAALMPSTQEVDDGGARLLGTLAEPEQVARRTDLDQPGVGQGSDEVLRMLQGDRAVVAGGQDQGGLTDIGGHVGRWPQVDPEALARPAGQQKLDRSCAVRAESFRQPRFRAAWTGR